MKTDRLSHLILPEYLIGIRKDKAEVMEHTTNTRCRSTVVFATAAGSSELGILVITCPDAESGALPESNWVFIPEELLVLNRPIAAYLRAKMHSKHFPGIPPHKISARDIASAIRTSDNRKRTHLLDQRNRWAEYLFLPSLSIRIDAFVSNSRIYPTNRFILDALRINRFTRRCNGMAKTIYGRVHIHYAYRFREIMSDSLINALHKKDKYFYELMTPLDAISMLDSVKAIREISDRRLSMTQQIEAIVALDPKNLRVVGRSIFDLQALESTAEINTFKELAGQAIQSRDIEAHIQWFEYIRSLSAPCLPQVQPC